MSMWARIQKLDGEASQQINLAYGENFPIEVRYALAHWIENQSWNDVDPDNPYHDTWAAQLFNDLIKVVELKAVAADNFLMRVKLRESADGLKQKYSANPQQLVRVIKNCLQTEINIIQQAESFCNGLNNHMDVPQHHSQEIDFILEKLKHGTQVTAEQVRRMQQEQEAFVIQYQESAKRQAQLQHGLPNPEMAAKLRQEKELLDRAVRQKVTDLINLRIDVIEKEQRIFEELCELQKRILDTELIQWKRAQQLAGNGATFENNLNQIQGWCEGLADVIWQNRQLIKQIESLCSQVPFKVHNDIMTKLPRLNSQITSLLSTLVASSLVIETQPPQIIKTHTRFTASARLLVGSKLGLSMIPPQVKVTIISESQAISLLKNDNTEFKETYGTILNNTGTMEYHEAARQLSVNFKNLQLRSFKRSEKKGTESVMDEKFSLLFQSNFNIGCGELVFQVWTISLPVVIIVHGVQEPHAWATITWDNAFAEHGRIPFQVPERIPWSQMAEVLRTKFKAATCRELTPENLQFLGWKVLRSNQVLDNALPITWSQFCKETLSERHFTFWEWFYAIMKTTREHLRNLWMDGLILGFISRHQAEEMLLRKVSGTFLLRFSDSELGGVTIAWVAQQREGPEVLMIQPFTGRDFAIRSLADRIKDLNNLVYLYPDTPKDIAFGKYYTPETENQPASHKGYLPRRLVTQIIGDANSSASGHGFESSPATPQSQSSSSDMAASGHGFESSPATPQSQTVSSSDMATGSSYSDVEEMIPDYLPEILEMDDSDQDIVDFQDINVHDLVFNNSQPST